MIPMMNLHEQYSRLKSDIDRKVVEVMESCQFINGPEVIKFEQEMAQFVGCSHTASCASGTDALILALRAHGIGKGDYVATSTFTFFATIEAILSVGARPILVDINEDSFNIDPFCLKQAVEIFRPRGLKAILVVDLFGMPANYEKINKLADAYDLPVIADAAQSMGSTYKAKRTGSLATTTCTSFYPTKPLGAYGDGGMVFSDNRDIIKTIRKIKNHGQLTPSHDYCTIGMNSRLDSIQAAILRVKLKHFDEDISYRRSRADHYNHLLQKSEFLTPRETVYCKSVYSVYSLRAKSREHRDAAVNKLRENGIATAIYYGIPMHLLTALEYLQYKKGDFPVSEWLSNTIFSIPLCSLHSQQRIVEILKGV
jgi:UDP-2-acetamido-2-deoxy-ribo-hexuluronate aminotransferase